MELVCTDIGVVVFYDKSVGLVFKRAYFRREVVEHMQLVDGGASSQTTIVFPETLTVILNFASHVKVAFSWKTFNVPLLFPLRDTRSVESIYFCVLNACPSN